MLFSAFAATLLATTSLASVSAQLQNVQRKTRALDKVVDRVAPVSGASNGQIGLMVDSTQVLTEEMSLSGHTKRDFVNGSVIERRDVGRGLIERDLTGGMEGHLGELEKRGNTRHRHRKQRHHGSKKHKKSTHKKKSSKKHKSSGKKHKKAGKKNSSNHSGKPKPVSKGKDQAPVHQADQGVQLATKSQGFSSTITWYTGEDLLNPYCGGSGWNPTDDDLIAAVTLSWGQGRPACGQFAKLTAPNGNSVVVRVVDMCAGCTGPWFDLTLRAFKQLYPLDIGKVEDIAVQYVSGPPGGDWSSYGPQSL